MSSTLQSWREAKKSSVKGLTVPRWPETDAEVASNGSFAVVCVAVLGKVYFLILTINNKSVSADISLGCVVVVDFITLRGEWTSQSVRC